MVRIISTANLTDCRECYYDSQVDGVVYEEPDTVPEPSVRVVLKPAMPRYCPQMEHIDLGEPATEGEW